jgi:hypothetical protein
MVAEGPSEELLLIGLIAGFQGFGEMGKRDMGAKCTEVRLP